MKPNSELKTQAQHDAIENRKGYGYGPRREERPEDDFQAFLWEQKIFADIVNFDADRMTCGLVGSIVACAAAIRVLKPMGIKARRIERKTT